MYLGQRVAVVVPAYNEQSQITTVLQGIPNYVDEVIVVDDGSTDGTATVARLCEDHGTPRHIIQHQRNRGVGAAIESGYAYAVRQEHDLIAVMAGDGQMQPSGLSVLLETVASGRADYAKGNRLARRNRWREIPPVRLIGNLALSIATQVASGIWGSWDSQSGFTVISRRAADALVQQGIYPRYGCPNDILIKLAALGYPVADVALPPVYHVGERSKLRVSRVLLTIPGILVRGAAWRIWTVYIRPRDIRVPLLLVAGTLAVARGCCARTPANWASAGALVASGIIVDSALTEARGRVANNGPRRGQHIAGRGQVAATPPPPVDQAYLRVAAR